MRGDRPFYCAPGVKSTNGTCLTRNGLLRYIDLYNKHNQHDKIGRSQIYGLSDKELIDEIRKKLNNVCSEKGDWCWADQPYAMEDTDIQAAYKPPAPKTRNQWLSTTDIDRVIEQFGQMCPDFLYLGAVPLDFDKLRGMQLSNENYCQFYLDRKKTKIGVVFNYDTHDKTGSHWVCLFCNITQGYIAFFDSVGVKHPRKEIRALIDSIKHKIEKCYDIALDRYVVHNMRVKINHNNIQKGNSECGVFCIYFIIKCLLGSTPEQIFNDATLSDEKMTEYRSKIFRPTLSSNNHIFDDEDLHY